MGILSGLLFILIAGVLQGTFYLPMTYTRKWEWEHTWSIFAGTGMIIFSWVFILLTVSNIFAVYNQASSQDIFILIIFGCIWGIGGVLNGLAIAKLGMALAYPIVIGTVASLGALIPLIVFFPETLLTVKGTVMIAGTIVTIFGIILCAKAFALKQPADDSSTKTDTGSMTGKLMIAIMAGVMSSFLNIGFAYSVGIVDIAKRLGASDTFAINAAWAIILTSGGIVNVLYCIYLMITHKTMKQFFGPETIRNLGLGALMGIMWCGGMYLYGFGAASMGSFGVIVGWVVFMSLVIIVGNLAGLWRGEWEGAPSQARLRLTQGLIILIIAIIIVAVSNFL